MKNLLQIIVITAVISFSLTQVYAQDESLTNIPIGKTALDVQIVGDRVYVTNPEEGVISIIDVESKQVVDTIPAQIGVLFIQVVEDKNKIYATVEGQNKVYVYDLETFEQIKAIDIGEKEIVLFSKADKPYGQREYTSFATSGIGLEYNNNNGMLYVVHSEVNHVNVIDTNTDETVGTINVGLTPVEIAIDEITNTAYVTNWESSDISVIDLSTNEVTGSIHTGFVPTQMVVDSDAHKLYVTHHASPHVSVVNLVTQTIEKQIKLQGPTSALALDKKAGLLHVTYLPTSGMTGQAFLNRVEFIDIKTNELVAGYEIPANPFVIQIDENGQLFASVIKDGMVFSIDLPERTRYQEVVAQVDEKPTEESQSKGGGCLIATATYGSELSPQVQQLRELRDNQLLQTASGTSFMSSFNNFYYSFSPTIADWERENPVFKEIVKITLTPMISSLSLLNHVDMDSEVSVLGYGISLIMLNVGMYFVAPVIVIHSIKKKF